MEIKYYDLTFSQKILLFSQQYTVHKQVNNISTALFVDQELDLEILRESIKAAYERMDSLSIRLVKRDGEIKQYFSQDKEVGIGYLDFRNMTFEDMEKRLYKIARKRISYHEKPLSEIYIIHTSDGRNGIFFKVSHFILDSWSISIFFKDIFSIYESMIEGKEIPKALNSYEELLIEDLNYSKTDNYQKDRQYFIDYFSKGHQPIFSHINGTELLEKYRRKKKDSDLRYGLGLYLRTKADNIMIEVDKEFVDKMADYCSKNRLPMQALVLLGLRSYLSLVTNDEETIVLNSVVARRGTLREKTSGGSRVHFIAFVTSINDGESFEEACNEISQSQMESYRHISIDPLEQLEIMKEIYNIPQTGTLSTASLTFQPVPLRLKNLNIETKWYGNGASGLPLYLTVMDGDGRGGLKFYYEYHTHNIARQTIDKLHNFILNFIEEGIKDDKLTIGQIKEVAKEAKSLNYS